MIADSSLSGSIIFWGIVIVLIIVVGLLVVLYVKRMLLSDDATTHPAFTLSDLRQMHKSGKMTAEEFERAKAKIIGTTTAPRPPANPPPPK
ncbi:MAG TPA: SHOCT domain-containing protein [Tepidisphaeraceae bacterium]|nr:SHOCT domain-containing protein [Tepidisphaeraceae bacterium]